MLDVSRVTAARWGRRRFLGGMLLAPFAGAAGAAVWTPGNGPYAVGSSCMQAGPATAAPMADYLVGSLQPQGTLYLDQLITDRQATLVIDVKVPKDFPYAGRLAGRSLPVVLTVFYPTPLRRRAGALPADRPFRRAEHPWAVAPREAWAPGLAGLCRGRCLPR